jgi:hypothetical protein
VKTQYPTKDRNYTDAEPASYSVYVGRKRLGRFVRIDRQEFDAFDMNDRHLGRFRTRKDALNIIQAALDECL